MTKDLIKRIAHIDQALRSHTDGYYNSRTFFTTRDDEAKALVPYDINDLVLLAALTNSDLLLSGTTGAGKTHLSRMIMNGLYGSDGFTNLTVTPGLGESDFIDIDIASVKSGKKTPKQAITTTPLLTQPGAIINEINRTPEILQNVFISYLERIFSLKGLEFPVGVGMLPGKDSPQDPHYQFRLLSINEGPGYSGTSAIDRAVRDRVALEIPMDHFRPRKEDIRQMIRNRNDSDLAVEKINGGKLEDVLKIIDLNTKIPLSVSADEFLVYLQGLSNCIRSATYSMRGIEFDQKDLCKGCHHVKDAVSDKGNICGSVYSPSDRSMINLKKIGRMVSALRAYKVINGVINGEFGDQEMSQREAKKFVDKYTEGLQVELDDLISVAPFVLANKTVMDPRWVSQYFQGSKFLATQHLLDTVRKKFTHWVGSPAYEALVKARGKFTPEVRAEIEKYVTGTDAWAYNLGDLAGNGYRPGNRDVSKLEQALS